MELLRFQEHGRNEHVGYNLFTALCRKMFDLQQLQHWLNVNSMCTRWPFPWTASVVEPKLYLPRLYDAGIYQFLNLLTNDGVLHMIL
jgi:hypothetical protein